MFTVPDKNEGLDNLQSIWFQEYIDILVAGISGADAVTAGCAVTPSAGMTLSVAAGAVNSVGTSYSIAATTPTIGAADATYSRFDFVVVTSAGAVAVRAGVAAATPKPPAKTVGDVVLAVVFVPVAAAAITASQIVDMRVQAQAASTINFLQAGAGAVSMTVQNMLRSLVSVKQFGAKGDGVTNDTVAIQAAIDYCRPNGLKLHIPAGVYIIGAPGLLVSNTGVGSTGGTPSVSYKMGLVGDGMASTILKYVGPDLAPCLKIITGGSSRSEFSGFTLLQDGATKIGYGLELVQSSHIEFENIGFEGFMFGAKAEDNFSIFWNNCRFAANTVGVEATFNTISRPNDFGFNNCNFIDNTENGARFQNPTTLSFNGGSFEGNGSSVAENGSLRINGNPVDGIAGINVSGVYFEGNKGSFDIGIYDSNNPGIHNIRGCTFNRVTSTDYVTTNIAFYKAFAAKTIVSIHGNGFAGFGSYVADAGRAYIQVPAPLDNNYVIDLGPNLWGDQIEKPVLLGAWAADSNVAAAVRFNGTTGVIDGASVNVTSVTINGVGDYTVSYTKPLRLVKNAYSIGVAEATMFPELFSESVSHLRFKTKNASAAYADFGNISLIVYGSDGAV